MTMNIARTYDDILFIENGDHIGFGGIQYTSECSPPSSVGKFYQTKISAKEMFFLSCPNQHQIHLIYTYCILLTLTYTANNSIFIPFMYSER